MTALIDTHIHLDFFEDPAAIVAEANKSNVGELIVPGVAAADWQRLLAVADSIPGVWAAPGLHPQEAMPWTGDLETTFRQALDHPRVVAIGEVGLDKQAAADLDVQENLLRRMIGMARDHELPLLLHVRCATGRVLRLLHQEKADRVGGIWHAFSGSIETAQQLFDLNFAIGVGGIVTFPEARRLPEVVGQAPAERLVLETDAPDMAPHPHRKKQNRPAYLPLIARKVAQLRNWSLEETAEMTSGNARKILRLP